MIGILRGGPPQLKAPHCKLATLQVHYIQLPAQLPVITQPAPIAYLYIQATLPASREVEWMEERPNLILRLAAWRFSATDNTIRETSFALWITMRAVPDP